jgi:signal transduction histidine kinase
MNAGAVITARPLQRALIRSTEPVAGYLYLVSQKHTLEAGRSEVFRTSLAGPALAAVVCVITLTTLLAAWIIAAVTRPLRVLSADVAAASRNGFSDAAALEQQGAGNDEFGQLREGFRMMLATLRMQWDKLRQLDHFRREGVSNLSHDLRSPLTATVACLETLERRWAADTTRAEDRALVEIALRNTRNAAQLVRSLGDLAQLDEPEFKLNTERIDVGDVLGDITLRFAERAAERGVVLRCELPEGGTPPIAAIDIELFERAVANLVDNAFKFTPAGGRIELSASAAAGQVQVCVADTGTGIAAGDIEHLFDRLYQSRDSVAPAMGDGGKGLGLAIVKRIAELHGGSVNVSSTPGRSTRVTISLQAG